MTWTVTIGGHDDLEAEAKAAFENGLVGMVKQLVEDIRSGEGITISNANVTTNSTGPVDLLSDEPLPNSGGGGEAEAVPPDEAEAAPAEPPPSEG